MVGRTTVLESAAFGDPAKFCKLLSVEACKQRYSASCRAIELSQSSAYALVDLIAMVLDVLANCNVDDVLL